jgi:hypothetical protein
MVSLLSRHYYYSKLLLLTNQITITTTVKGTIPLPLGSAFCKPKEEKNVIIDNGGNVNITVNGGTNFSKLLMVKAAHENAA